MDKITKDMSVEDLIDAYPQTVQIFIHLGLPCLVCGEPFWGTVEELARKYNADPDQVLKSLNEGLEGLKA
jgi:hybrid cluster-associated redox disulfide protein